MLSPTSEFAPVAATIILVVLLVALVLRAVRKDRKEYGRFKRYRSSIRRQRLYRKWLIEAFVAFGGSAMLLLLLVWQYIPLFFAAFDRLPGIIWVRKLASDNAALASGVAIGLAVAFVVGGFLVVFFARNSKEVPAIGDIAALLPRNRAELRYGALLSINAGVVEELLFRLALPLLIFAASGNVAFAIAASVALFGLLHLYQGVWGVIGSLVIGSILMASYLAAANILLPMVLHALIDLRSLVLIPMVVYRVHRIKDGTPPTTAPAAP